jgi:hypothetical protein
MEILKKIDDFEDLGVDGRTIILGIKYYGVAEDMHNWQNLLNKEMNFCCT